MIIGCDRINLFRAAILRHRDRDERNSTEDGRCLGLKEASWFDEKHERREGSSQAPPTNEVRSRAWRTCFFHRPLAAPA